MTLIPVLNQANVYTGTRLALTAAGTYDFRYNDWPGKNIGRTSGNNPQYVAYSVWNYLWGNLTQVDAVIDLITPTPGLQSTFWCYADFRTPYVERMAKLMENDMLKINRGEEGSLNTAVTRRGIPEITAVVGTAKRIDPVQVQRAVDWIGRVMDDMYINPQPEGREPYQPDLSKTYIGNSFYAVRAAHGGFVDVKVQVLDQVEEGQLIAEIKNDFGQVIQELRAPKTSLIHQIPHDTVVEPGLLMMSVIYNDTAPECQPGCVFLNENGDRLPLLELEDQT